MANSWSSWLVNCVVDLETGCVLSVLRRWRFAGNDPLTRESKFDHELRWCVPDYTRPEGPLRSRLVEVAAGAVAGLNLYYTQKVPIEIHNVHRAFWDKKLREEGSPERRPPKSCRLCLRLAKLATKRGLGTDIMCAKCWGSQPATLQALLFARRASGKWADTWRNKRLEAIVEEKGAAAPETP